RKGKFRDLYIERWEKDTKGDRCGDRNGICSESGEFSASIEWGQRRQMDRSAFGFLLVVLLVVSGCAAARQNFETTGASVPYAIAHNRGKEFLAAMEAMGSQAEREARWADASTVYSRATAAAKEMGQLQKAVSYGTKAVDLAQRARDPIVQQLAIGGLASAYNSLGQFEKEREWLLKRLEVAKQITGKENIEIQTYAQLGENFLRQGDVQKAVEYISHSVQIMDSRVSGYKR